MAARQPIGTVTVSQAIRTGADRLRAVAEHPRLEARLLLAHALGLTNADLIRDPDAVVDTGLYATLLDRRACHEPIAYLIGRQEFWSLDFRVSQHTLIPRPDSETIVAAALDLSANPRRVLDLGTGSGCLLIAILHERPAAFGVGIDRSAEALAIARANAFRCGVGHRAGFVRADWTASIVGHFDLIVANPPYVPRGDINGLMPGVARYEPRAALDGGDDGLDAYRRIVPALDRLVARPGHAVLEVGAGQADAVARLCRSVGMYADTREDLAGIARAVLLSRSGS